MGNTTQEFVLALKQMGNAGAQIIVDDAVYFHEPMFQDGLAAQTIDQLVFDKSIAYFTSAGNTGRNAYQAAFANSHTYPLSKDEGVAHDFNPSPRRTDTCQSITVGADILTVFSLQWDQPSHSVDGSAGSNSDLDIVFYDDPECKKLSTGRVIGGSTDNLEKDAAEVAGYSNIGNRKRKNIGIRILLTAGPEPNLIKYVISGSSLPIEHPRINEYATPNAIGTAFGHGNASGAFVVGAVEASHASRRSLNPTYYSSLGGLPILFDSHGDRLDKPLVRNHVDAVAPTNVNTSFFTTSRPDPEHDGKPNFTGTSAAAPHVAGVAALLLEAATRKSLKLKPTDLYDILQRSSRDTGPPGFDFATGHGLIQADRAVQLVH
jgi:subtilisin family serine protease